MKRTLSPRDLATALGVSESSLKRWADRGAVRVFRTAGGHRRITVPDAIDFIRGSDLQLVRPDILGLPELSRVVGDPPHRGEESAKLLAHLVEGRAAEARGLVSWMFLDGMSMAAICDGPIREAMEELGRMWVHRPDGIFLEHRATDICVQALNQARATQDLSPGAPVAVGGAPSGDPYLLPSLMAATTLTTEGFHAVNLGPETPVETLVDAARIHQPVLVWLSVTGVHDAGSLRTYVEELATSLQSSGAQLVLGGREARRIDAAAMPNLHRGESMHELVAIARESAGWAS